MITGEIKNQIDIGVTHKSMPINYGSLINQIFYFELHP
jgi:hypothetical protein